MQVWQREEISFQTSCSSSKFATVLIQAVEPAQWLDSKVSEWWLRERAADSEVTEDADVRKLFAVAFGSQEELEGPLQAHSAPHSWQVETPRVSESWSRETCVTQSREKPKRSIYTHTDTTRITWKLGAKINNWINK